MRAAVLAGRPRSPALPHKGPSPGTLSPLEPSYVHFLEDNSLRGKCEERGGKRTETIIFITGDSFKVMSQFEKNCLRSGGDEGALYPTGL